MKQSYTALSAELDQVMADLEGGSLDIDQAVSRYERGLAIVKELEGYLKDAENKVTELKAAALADLPDDDVDDDAGTNPDTEEE